MRAKLFAWDIATGQPRMLTLTPAVRAVLDGWQKFLTENPGQSSGTRRGRACAGNRQLLRAAEGGPDCGRRLRRTVQDGVRHQGFSPRQRSGSASTADRAAFLRAVALDTQARKVLALALAERRGPTPPPTELSKEFATALTAYTSSPWRTRTRPWRPRPWARCWPSPRSTPSSMPGK